MKETVTSGSPVFTEYQTRRNLIQPFSGEMMVSCLFLNKSFMVPRSWPFFDARAISISFRGYMRLKNAVGILLGQYQHILSHVRDQLG